MSELSLSNILTIEEESLLKMVPYEHNRNGWAYGEIFKINPDWYNVVTCLSDLISSSKNRASKFDWEFNLKLKYMAKLWIEQQGRCAITGIVMSTEAGCYEKNPYKISIDRIYNYRGYVAGNIRLLTHWANNAKNTWDDTLMFEFMRSASKNYVIKESVPC